MNDATPYDVSRNALTDRRDKLAQLRQELEDERHWRHVTHCELAVSQEEARRLREALLNVRIHTGIPPAPTLKLTCGLLTHIAEIVDNALSRGEASDAK